jgi:spore maturation protein CgeB
MRVGIVGPAEPDTFGNNIGHCLTNMGHLVTYLGQAKPSHSSRSLTRISEVIQQAYPRLEDRIQRRIAERAIESQCEVVIVTDSMLVPDVVTRLRRNRIAVALWFPDAVVNMGRARMLAAPYTALFFKDRLLVDRLRDTLDVPVWYLPQACNPSWHRPLGTPGKNKHIVVVGNTYLSRLLLLERLVKDGVPIVIYGAPIPRWAPQVIPDSCHTGKSVYCQEKSKVFREAAGVLNNLHPGEMHGLNVRLFEATAAGAAVLCERRPALEELYDTSSEVVAFSSYAELIGGVRDLLESPTMTEEIGDAATKRAHNEHTYEIRLSIMLEKLV